jgi:hypothetical protein
LYKVNSFFFIFKPIGKRKKTMSSTFFKINANKDGIKFMDKITLQLNENKSHLELKTFNENLAVNESANLLCFDYKSTNGNSFNDLCKKVQDLDVDVDFIKDNIQQDKGNVVKINKLEFKMSEGNIKIFDDIDQISESLYELKDNTNEFKNDLNQIFDGFKSHIESLVLGNSEKILDNSNGVLDNSNKIDQISRNMNVDSGNIHDFVVESRKNTDKKIECINDMVVELKQYTINYVDENLSSLKNEIYYKIRTEIQDEITRDLKFDLVESLKEEMRQELLESLKEEMRQELLDGRQELFDQFNLKFILQNDENTNKYNKLIVENCSLKNELNSVRENVKDLEEYVKELDNTNKERIKAIELKKSFNNVLDELTDSFSKKQLVIEENNINQEIKSLKESVDLLQKDNKIIKELSDKMVLFGDEMF